MKKFALIIISIFALTYQLISEDFIFFEHIGEFDHGSTSMIISTKQITMKESYYFDANMNFNQITLQYYLRRMILESNSYNKFIIFIKNQIGEKKTDNNWGYSTHRIAIISNDSVTTKFFIYGEESLCKFLNNCIEYFKLESPNDDYISYFRNYKRIYRCNIY